MYLTDTLCLSNTIIHSLFGGLIDVVLVCLIDMLDNPQIFKSDNPKELHSQIKNSC